MDEVDISMDKCLPPAKSWTGVVVYDALAKIVAQVSGRVFVGPELCHEPVYLDAAINYTMDVNYALIAVK
jgi:hypothetical protein